MMTAAAFKVWREFLGLPRTWVAGQFGVTQATVRRWETGGRDVPAAADHAMHEWVTTTANFVGALTVTMAKASDAGAPHVLAPDDTYSGDDLAEMPPTWHRMVAARVAERTGYPIRWKL